MDLSAVIELVENVDVLQLKLSAEEGFVLSRVDGRSSCDDLIILTGFPQPMVMSALQKLQSLGVIKELGADSKARPAGSAALSKSLVVSTSASNHNKVKTDTANDDPYADLVIAPGDLRDDLDIDHEQQKRILFFEKKLDEWNHFELLGLLPDANPAQVRKAYFLASKKFHPDAFFRKELGPFTQKISLIFKAMKVAYDVLSNEKTREAYAKTATWSTLTASSKTDLDAQDSGRQSEVSDEVNASAEAADSQEMLRKALQAAEDQAKRAEREKKRKETVRKRRLRRNPMMQRIKKAAKLYQLGLESLGREEWSQAANHLALAITFDPQKKKYHQSYSDAAGMANYIRAQKLLGAMSSLVEADDSEAILGMVEELRHVAEDNAEIMAQAAQILLKIGDVRRAFELAQISVSMQENFIPGLCALADTAERAKRWHAAQRALQQLCVHKPQNKSYSARLKQVSKNVK